MLFYEAFSNIRNITLGASTFALVIMFLRLIFKRAPKWVRCFMWALLAVRLILPIYLFEIPVDYIPDTPIVSEQTLYVTEPSAEVIEPDNGYDNVISAPALPEKNEPEAFESVTPEGEDGQTEVNTEKKYDYEPVIYAIWFLGVCAMLLYALISYIRLKRKVRTATLLKENQLICDDIGSPFILGFIKPQIYLPSALSEETLGYVLSHEKAHIKRRDYLWKPFGFILLSLNWFNPILWLSYILLCRDIELACDERVIKEMNKKDKKGYSEALLHCSVPQKLLTACPVSFGEVGVKHRIKAVLNYRKSALLVVVTAVVVSIVVTTFFMAEAVEKNKDADYENAQETTFGLSLLDYSSIPDDSDIFNDKVRFVECDEKVCILPEVIKTGVEGNFEYAVHEGGFIQILKYNGKESNVKIPDKIENYPVSFIGNLSFAEGDPLGDLKEKTDCVIETVTCPDNIVCIANDAFYGCRRLKNIDFGDNLICVGNLAFAHCEALEDISFSESLRVIGWSSFENIGITQIIIPKSLEYIGSGAFADCKLLKNIDFQGGTIFFGSGIIENSAVETLYIPANLNIVGDGGIFCSENLRRVEYAEVMEQDTIVYAEMYRGCSSLEEIKLPSNVSVIEEYAFQGCSSLKQITIPKSVKSVETRAFTQCYLLTDIYFESENCDGLEDSGISLQYRRIHAPVGGNIEEFCNKNLLLQFISA